MTCNFRKERTLAQSEKQIFDISKLFLQCNTDSYSEHLIFDVNIYSHIF